MEAKVDTVATRAMVLPNVTLLSATCPCCGQALLILPPDTIQVWPHGVLTSVYHTNLGWAPT